MQQHQREFAEFYAATRDDCAATWPSAPAPITPTRAPAALASNLAWEFVPASAPVNCTSTPPKLDG